MSSHLVAFFPREKEDRVICGEKGGEGVEQQMIGERILTSS